MWTRGILATVAVAAAAAPALAVDGVLEINQTCATQTGCFAGDTAGFPVTITAGGSYRLTSSLVNTGTGSTILISQPYVTLDLGGFSVRGNDLPGSIGILASTSGCIVKNGFVVDFAIGVAGGDAVRVEDLFVRSIAGTAISLGDRSHVLRNTVEADFSGISVGAAAYVADNAVMNISNTAIALGTGASAHGNAISDAGTNFTGTSMVGTNLCDGDTCAAPPLRRFYLTQQTYNGAQAPNACAEGFHMASLYEIKETSTLRYDTDLGQSSGDAGDGPPTPYPAAGWVRTGQDSASSGPAGYVNCNAYTTASGSAAGSAVFFPIWDDPPAHIGENWGWSSVAITCDTLMPVWCVQD